VGYLSDASKKFIYGGLGFLLTGTFILYYGLYLLRPEYQPCQCIDITDDRRVIVYYVSFSDQPKHLF